MQTHGVGRGRETAIPVDSARRTRGDMTPAARGLDIWGSAPVQVWRTSWASAIGVLYASGFVIGAAVESIACWHLAQGGAGDNVAGNLFSLAWGVYMSIIVSAFAILPASRAEMYADGCVKFMARRRSLMVKPGELQSIRALPLDFRRLGPMRVTAERGTAWVHTRMDPALELLFDAMRRSSPEAVVADPRSGWPPRIWF